MKRFFILFSIFNSFFVFSQTYLSNNISLVSHINPQTSFGEGVDNRRYSGCWGWYQASKNKEYALVGTSAFTYFIDISSPATPVICDSVPGKAGCTWRELKTYQNYCYVVSDDGAPNRFQIIDMQYLPDSVHVVLDDNSTYFERGHTIWIDKDKMYIGAQTKQGGAFESMTVYSLATPTAPVLLRNLSDDYNFINIVHDMFVRNDTVFASCGYQGLYVFKLKSDTTFEQIGSFTGYSPNATYNHSSYITDNGKYLVFADEVPAAMPARIIDVQNMANIVQTATMNLHMQTTPHNPYVVGNRWAIVSSYEDGLVIFDIHNPLHPLVSGFFDTHPQGGFEQGYLGGAYRGNWGAYPFFPSGLILACDMQNGIFILDASATYSQPIGLVENSTLLDARIFPNPASHFIKVYSTHNQPGTLRVFDLTGKLMMEKKLTSVNYEKVNIEELPAGVYSIKIETGHLQHCQKLIKTQTHD